MTVSTWGTQEVTSTKLNEMVTQINTNTTAIAGKATVCSTTPEPCSEAGAVGVSEDASRCDHVHQAVGDDSPQDVASAASVGTETLASRQDHAHRGVSRLIAGTNITLSPTSGYGAVTVTAAAAAGGVTAVEKTFDGAFTAGDIIVSDTPTSDKLLVAGYFELTTTDGFLGIQLRIGSINDTGADIYGAGHYIWFNQTRYEEFNETNGYEETGGISGGWKPGTALALRCCDSGTGSGKLIIYYATIA